MIGNKYIIEEKISSGQFGKVYKGKHKRTHEQVAIKCESLDSPILLIKQEATLLNYLYNKGCRNVPFVYYYGIFKNSSTLVMPFYGENLNKFLKNNPSNETILQITIKMINILEEIHNQGVIHRDIKTENFMLHNEEIYLIDLGLSSIFLDENMNHLPGKHNSSFIIGTPKFISIHVHNGKDPSRRDDIISLLYLYVYMMNDSYLPWENVKHIEDSYEPQHILHSKNQERKKIKEEFQDNIYDDAKEKRIFDYVYSLEYEEMPRYQYIIELLSD